MRIETIEDLRNLYGWPRGRAAKKVLSQLEKHAKNFISLSPFIVTSTISLDGKADASPKGGLPGFVKVLDDNTIIIPDSKGNNRVDSLINIVETGSIGILFFIPGIDEMLRINGKAYIETSNKFLDIFSEMRLMPKSCLVVEIEEVFLHCAKALMRSELWKETYKVEKGNFPTISKMLNDQLKDKDAVEESRNDMIKRYKADL